jgi:hypothetical protein
MIERGVGPPQPKKHIPSKWVYEKYKTWIKNMEPPKPNFLEKKMGQDPP